MTNPIIKDVIIHGITLTAITSDTFAVPGRGKINGRANAIRAAKNMIAENSTLRNERNRAMRNG